VKPGGDSRPAAVKILSCKKENAAGVRTGGILEFLPEKLPKALLSSVVEGFGEDAAAVEGVVNNFADGGDVRVDVHAVAGAQVADDSLGRDVEGRSAQFRITARLDVVNHLQPFCQRKSLGSDHFSSAPYFFGPPNINLDRWALY
jgi:hypothetical protein